MTTELRYKHDLEMGIGILRENRSRGWAGVDSNCPLHIQRRIIEARKQILAGTYVEIRTDPRHEKVPAYAVRAVEIEMQRRRSAIPESDAMQFARALLAL